MKKEKGITLISLVIYVILLMLVIGMLATMSQMFFANTKNLTDSSKNMTEFNKFNMYFIEDVKNNDGIYSITDTEIVFNDGTSYTYKTEPDNSIYRNKVKICNNIGFVRFTTRNEIVDNVTKKIISVKMVVNGTNLFETDSDYVLRYW